MLKFDWNILWTIINLVIFFLLMKRFLFKPIRVTLDKRKELIDNQFKAADDAQKQADNLKAQYEGQLEGVEEAKKQMLDDARLDAKSEYDKIVNRAQTDADKIKADAKRNAELETEKARRSVKEELAALAMETAEKVVGERASAELDRQLYDEFLNESSDES